MRAGTVVAGVAVAMMVAACDARAPESHREPDGCRLTRDDTLALTAAARDTMTKLKARAQVVTEITAVAGGVAIRTEDADANAFHNGGAVSFDCAKRVTSVWIDGG